MRADSAMRIIFCGTPEFAVPSLRALAAEADFSVEAVVTQPDRPRGRGQKTGASAVKQAALDLGLHVYQPEKISHESAEEFLKSIAPDAVILIAYGQIIPARLLALPRLGWINLHASLLPRYRGASPIQWAIANGETRTGLTTMQISAGLDTGPILLQREIEIGPDETAPELSARMAEAGAPLVVETLRRLNRDAIVARAQDSSAASLARLLKKEDGQIDWTLTAREIYNRMRAFAPWPGAYSTLREQRCHLWGRPGAASVPGHSDHPGEIIPSSTGVYVACGEATCLQLEAVQMEGRKRVKARDFANGMRLLTGERFGV